MMRPFAPVDLYYEECDTYSPTNRPLPKWMNGKESVVLSEPIPISEEKLQTALNQHGIYYGERTFGIRHNGEMVFTEQAVSIPYTEKDSVHYFQTHYSMLINSKLESFERITTVFHEIGHLLCGHLTEDKSIRVNRKIHLTIPKRDMDSLSREQEEFEAEKTCEFIMKALGYSFDSSKYLSGYLIDEKEPYYDFGFVVAATYA